MRKRWPETSSGTTPNCSPPEPLPVLWLLSIPGGSVTLRDAHTGTCQVVQLQSLKIAAVAAA